VARRLIEGFPWETAPRFLPRDRDASYGWVFSRRSPRLEAFEIVTARRSPGQDVYVERVIGSIRRESSDISVPEVCSISIQLCPF
jgi:putative transposase